MTNLEFESRQPGSRAYALDLHTGGHDLILTCWLIVKIKCKYLALRPVYPKDHESGPPVHSGRQWGPSHGGLRCICHGCVCHVGRPGKLRKRAVFSPGRGSRSFFQIENQP